MIRELSHLSFTYLLLSFYSWYVIWQIMIHIGGRSCVFFYNDNDVVFTRIHWMIYITFSKMGVFTFFNLLIFCMNFTLKSCFFFSRSFRSLLYKESVASCSPMVCQCSSWILFLRYCRTWGDNKLQQYLLKFSAVSYWW